MDVVRRGKGSWIDGEREIGEKGYLRVIQNISE